MAFCDIGFSITKSSDRIRDPMAAGFFFRTGGQGSALNTLFWDTFGQSILFIGKTIEHNQSISSMLFAQSSSVLLSAQCSSASASNSLYKTPPKKTTLCLNQSWTSIGLFFFFSFFGFCDRQLPAYTVSSIVCIRYISKFAHQATRNYKNLKANPPNSCAKILSFLLCNIVLS